MNPLELERIMDLKSNLNNAIDNQTTREVDDHSYMTIREIKIERNNQ